MACVSFAVVCCKRVLAERLPIIGRCVERMFRKRPTKCLYEYSKDFNVEKKFQFDGKVPIRTDILVRM